VLTFGLFALVVNAFTIQLTAALVSSFEVRSFASAVLAALIMALLGLVGFILMQWLMGGEIHWFYMTRQQNMYF